MNGGGGGGEATVAMGKLSGDGNRQANLGNARYVLQKSTRARKELSNSVHRNGMDADTPRELFVCNCFAPANFITEPIDTVPNGWHSILYVARPDIEEHSVGQDALKRFLSQLKLWEALCALTFYSFLSLLVSSWATPSRGCESI